jgi:hypothetical protein
MAFANGGSIVTNGLVLALDAADRNSYVSGSTTWNDLSGNNNSGSLVNGPTFSSANGGSIVFDGTNDYVFLPTNFFNHDSGSAFTVSFWFRTATAGIIFGQQNSPTASVAASGYVPAIYTDSAGKVRTSCFWGGAVNNQSVSALTVTDNAWHNVAVTFASSSQISYIDNTQFATLAKTQTTYSPTYNYFIGSGTWVGQWANTTGNPFFTGNVSNMLFYNRALTAAEISQNFNATRGRFNL